MSAEKDGFARFLKHFPKGTVLFNEGDEGEDMYIIRSGQVAIRKRVPHGETTLAVLEKGDFFGEMALLERRPRSAGAEVVEDADLIVIGSEIFGDMIKGNPEIAVRMLRKYCMRLREMTKQLEDASSRPVAAAPADSPPAGSTLERPVEEPPQPAAASQHTEALAYFISKASGNVFSVLKSDSLIGRYDSVTGLTPDVDLTNEDSARNISRRHARIVVKDGKPFVAEEIGTMNGTYLNGRKLPTGVLTPISDGDELTLCRLTLTFRLPGAGAPAAAPAGRPN
jgi:CRP-like cAMP-binding protein